MKSVKKFEEYELDLENSNFTNEYAKLIISTYLDKKDDETLESVYAEIIEGDELEEQQNLIIRELQMYLLVLWKESKKVRTLINISANKYNL